eukprot:677351-Rhodomonas_salina.1
MIRTGVFAPIENTGKLTWNVTERRLKFEITSFSSVTLNLVTNALRSDLRIDPSITSGPRV